MEDILANIEWFVYCVKNCRKEALNSKLKTNKDLANYIRTDLKMELDDLAQRFEYQDEIGVSEAINPAHERENKMLKDILTGNSRAYKNVEKMGYKVEVDDSAQKQFGKDYFGKNVDVVNPETGRKIHANIGHRYRNDVLLAKDNDKTSKGWHKLAGDASGKKANKDAFDYKGFLDKPIPEKEDPNKLTTVQQFKRDRQFLKDNEYQEKQINQARQRVDDIRARLSK